MIRSFFNPPPPKGSFTDSAQAVKYPNGLVSIGGEINPGTVINAHKKGMFAYSYNGLVRWWSPEPRMVLFLHQFKVQKELRRYVRQERYKITFDQEFKQVMRKCAQREETWISEHIIDVYYSLHKQGYMHSVEVWDKDGQLVGGLFGLALGKVFFTNSLFTHANNASKVAFMYLNCHLQYWGYIMNDLKMHNGYWINQGCILLSRKEFHAKLDKAVLIETELGTWSIDETLNVAIWKPEVPGSQLE
ncbi:MAG: leucyl/phenylalanyl-tRNA--protein transferase [Pseudomonadota bacterium]